MLVNFKEISACDKQLLQVDNQQQVPNNCPFKLISLVDYSICIQFKFVLILIHIQRPVRRISLFMDWHWHQRNTNSLTFYSSDKLRFRLHPSLWIGFGSYDQVSLAQQWTVFNFPSLDKQDVKRSYRLEAFICLFDDVPKALSILSMMFHGPIYLSAGKMWLTQRFLKCPGRSDDTEFLAFMQHISLQIFIWFGTFSW